MLTYGYDEDGNVTSISDSQGGLTKQTWDGGLLVSKTYQDSSTNTTRNTVPYVM